MKPTMPPFPWDRLASCGLTCGLGGLLAWSTWEVGWWPVSALILAGMVTLGVACVQLVRAWCRVDRAHRAIPD